MMLELLVTSVLTLVTVYLICGLLFALYFLTKGIHKIDEGANGSSLGFRMVITPGVIVFWVILLKKIMNKK